MKEPPGEDRILRNGMRKALILLLAACALFLCAAGSAESMHGEIPNEAFDMEVTVGYNGAVTYGKVIPVRVRIRNYGDDFEGVLGINAYVSNREYDRYEKTIALPAGAEREYEIDGDMPISDFLELTGIREEDFEFESETVGGWTIEYHGSFPQVGTSFHYRNFQVTVLAMDEHRVERVLVTLDPEHPEEKEK